MKYFQYTGSQPETGMVVMEVEMVSGTKSTNLYQFAMIMVMLMSMMLMVSGTNFYQF